MAEAGLRKAESAGKARTRISLENESDSGAPCEPKHERTALRVVFPRFILLSRVPWRSCFSKKW